MLQFYASVEKYSTKILPNKTEMYDIGKILL